MDSPNIGPIIRKEFSDYDISMMGDMQPLSGRSCYDSRPVKRDTQPQCTQDINYVNIHGKSKIPIKEYAFKYNNEFQRIQRIYCQWNISYFAMVRFNRVNDVWASNIRFYHAMDISTREYIFTFMLCDEIRAADILNEVVSIIKDPDSI